MGLAGEHELDRHLRIVDQRGDAIDILENQVGSFVGREPPREADRQRVEAQRPAQLSQHFFRLAAPLGLPHRMTANEVEQPRLERLMRFPQSRRRRSLRSFPTNGVRSRMLRPIGPKMSVVDLTHLRRQPRRHMHAVGDVTDRHLFLRPIGHRPVHMLRDTCPCSDETAFARRESLSASTVMQKSSPGL